MGEANDNEKNAKSLLYLVLSGCLIALTVSVCVLFSRLGRSAQSVVEIQRERMVMQRPAEESKDDAATGEGGL